MVNAHRCARIVLAAIALAGLPRAAQAADDTLPLPVNPVARQAASPPAGPRIVRFLTTADFPPFQYLDERGELAGINVDIARAVCRALDMTCTVQAWAWDNLVAALEDGQGDGVIAGRRPDAALREQVLFSRRYLARPAQFVWRGERARDPAALPDVPVGVVEGTVHEAFLKAHAPQVSRVAFVSREALRGALVSGSVTVGFDDALASIFWLAGVDARGCCHLEGVPYLDDALFGPGQVAFFRLDDRELRAAFDAGLQEIVRTGAYEEILLRHIPGKLF